jgi:hypothetical protein
MKLIFFLSLLLAAMVSADYASAQLSFATNLHVG